MRNELFIPYMIILKCLKNCKFTNVKGRTPRLMRNSALNMMTNNA